MLVPVLHHTSNTSQGHADLHDTQATAVLSFLARSWSCQGAFSCAVKADTAL